MLPKNLVARIDGSEHLPKFKSHKVVGAFKIGEIVSESEFSQIKPTEEYNCELRAVVTNDWLEKYKPKVGGYIVNYGDGYLSYSPAEPFEEGYTIIIV